MGSHFSKKHREKLLKVRGVKGSEKSEMENALDMSSNLLFPIIIALTSYDCLLWQVLVILAEIMFLGQIYTDKS